MGQAYYPPAGGGGTDDQTASEVPYAPASGAAWLDPDPTDVAGGLDKLAPLTLGSYNILADAGAEAAAGDVLTIDGPAGSAAWGPVDAEVSLGAVSSGNVDASSTVNVDVALPAGVTRFLITELVITRTAGTGANVIVSSYSDDARTIDRQYLIGGNGFGNSAVTPGPVYGPSISISADTVRPSIPYRNTEAEEFIRLEVDNQDVGNAATYSITIRGIPLRAA